MQDLVKEKGWIHIFLIKLKKGNKHNVDLSEFDDKYVYNESFINSENLHFDKLWQPFLHL